MMSGRGNVNKYQMLIMNIHSIKELGTFTKSIRLVIRWLWIYDKLHYGRWLSNFWVDMVNLSEHIAQLMPAIFSHSITGKPYLSG